MSTACKLDPRVRESRTMRSQMTRDTAHIRDKMAAEHGIGSALADQLHTVADFLYKVHHSSWRTGWDKNRLFRQIARELAGVQLAGQS